ncbi:hypothetical protein BJY21_000968 [Kineosphaera limosa]|uniref:Uncharacterized protein n=1 Tax=Kineosphaera limosa NBRC 100340 TaxID=1184609 RepID=K6XAQ4_9MICO|nr:hypothetical protein [Kineosphaera limosa]NYD99783.1 hypothetical protein [Kineosphaera limosa]GAB95884.1 hypothetical protein KILIM_028_00380 [Kineosphaera limosa NBRC 100340]
MSPKSRPPKAKKKGRKGRKGADEVAETTIVIEEPPTGPPFGMIVLLAVVVCLPSLMAFVDGTMAFDAAALRFLAALTVSWLLVNLVYAVAKSFAKPAEEETSTTTVESMSYANDPNAAYRLPADPAQQ